MDIHSGGVTEDVSDRLLRLPFYNDLTEADQALVVTAVKDFSRERNSALSTATLGAVAVPGEERS